MSGYKLLLVIKLNVGFIIKFAKHVYKCGKDSRNKQQKTTLTVAQDTELITSSMAFSLASRFPSSLAVVLLALFSVNSHATGHT